MWRGDNKIRADNALKSIIYAPYSFETVCMQDTQCRTFHSQFDFVIVLSFVVSFLNKQLGVGKFQSDSLTADLQL